MVSSNRRALGEHRHNKNNCTWQQLCFHMPHSFKIQQICTGQIQQICTGHQLSHSPEIRSAQLAITEIDDVLRRGAAETLREFDHHNSITRHNNRTDHSRTQKHQSTQRKFAEEPLCNTQSQRDPGGHLVQTPCSGLGPIEWYLHRVTHVNNLPLSFLLFF